MQYKEVLETKAIELCEQYSKNNYTAQVLQSSFREFSVKIQLEEHGNLVLYYSPKKSLFSIVYSELKNKDIIPILEQISSTNLYPKDNNFPQDIQNKNAAIIYVDGAYRNSKIGYGAVILDKNQNILNEISDQLIDEENLKSRHIPGEIEAVKKALEWCNQNNINEAFIYYDYDGIEKWATGEWKPKLAFSQNYVNIINSTNIKIHWNKVKSHSGNCWNNYADRLAHSLITE